MAVINITEYDGWQDGVVEAKVAEAGVWLWAGFKESLIQIKSEHTKPHQPEAWLVLTNRNR